MIFIGILNVITYDSLIEGHWALWGTPNIRERALITMKLGTTVWFLYSAIQKLLLFLLPPYYARVLVNLGYRASGSLQGP